MANASQLVYHPCVVRQVVPIYVEPLDVNQAVRMCPDSTCRVIETTVRQGAAPQRRIPGGTLPGLLFCSKMILSCESPPHNSLIMQILEAAVFGQKGRFGDALVHISSAQLLVPH